MFGRRASKTDSLFTPLLGDTGKKKLPNVRLGTKGVKYAVTARPLKIKDIKEIAKKWKNEPLKDPYNNKDVPLSIHPKSEYVLLYKKIIDGLIKDLVKDLVKDFESIHPHLDYVLTIDDCINIRNALPDMHSIITISETEKIKYDHLFIKYFVNKTRKYKYDVNYCKDSEINLYLNVYNAIKRKNPTVKSFREKLKEYKNKALSRLPFKKTAVNQSSKSQSFAKDNYVLIEDLLQNNIDLDKTDISISKILLRLSIDIRTISYMHESKFTFDNFMIVLSNKKILEYVASLYKADFVAGLISEDIKKHLQKKIIFNPPRDGDEIYFIYEDIQIFSKDDNNEVILNRFINIYNTIEILYKNYFASKINKGSSNRRSNGKSNGYEYLEIQMTSQEIYKDSSKGIIGLYSFHITIKLGDMGFPIINSTPDGDKIYNNNPELNNENSLILKLPMFNEQKYKNANTYVIQLMKEIQDKIKIDKFLKKKTFPYRINNEENERWNIIVDLPPFDFDIDEDSDIVFERFKKYVKNIINPE
jgi:hypothetical protein